MGRAIAGSDDVRVEEAAGAPEWQSPRSRVDHAAEQAALALARSGRREDALRILMSAYGAAVTGFVLRVVRDRELAKDIRQQVFLQAFQALDRFEARGSFWSWLCGIAYHRCLDELRRVRRASALDDLDLGGRLVAEPAPAMDEARLRARRALEHCMAKLTTALRDQLLMRYLLGLSYAEIGELVGATHATVQIRIARILPRLRQCLRDEGVM